MKKIILICSLLLISQNVFAEYTFRYPVPGVFNKDQNSGNENEVDPEDGKEAWEQFAIDNDLNYYDDWHELAWNYIDHIPTEPYPSSYPFAHFYD